MVKATDVAYGRIQAPDLDKMEAYLTDFGMTRSARTETALYMRGTDSDHHIHVTHLGEEPKFLGMAFNVGSMEDLQALSTMDDVSEVEESDEPGGGYRVQMTDPDGYRVEAIYGMEQLDPLPLENAYIPNLGSERRRSGELVRLEHGPCQVKRLGHVVIDVPDFKASDTFYQSHFNFLRSDQCYAGDDKDNIVVAFNRVDRGKEFVDHHTLLCVESDEPRLGHLAFEVEDINAVYLGHEYLKAQGYVASWGIGRHLLGSQIFDYWFDPYGHRMEHWADSDLLNEDHKTGTMPVNVALNTQWGVTVADRRASMFSDYDPLRDT